MVDQMMGRVAVRSDVRAYVVEHLTGDDAVLGGRRDGGCEEGHRDRRRPASVHRHRRPDRELADRCLPRVLRGARARRDRPGPLRSALVARRLRPSSGRRRQPAPARGAGSPADRLCPGRRQHPRSPHSCGEVPHEDAGCWSAGTGELAFYRCFSPRPVPLSELARVAGRRWTIEETFQSSKGLTGPDEHQVTRWTSWYRWVTLAMLAHAFLAVTTATERKDRPAPASLIPLTGNEIQHLFAALVRPFHDLPHRLRWSQWRRQARARTCHYRQQAATQP